MTPFQFKHYKIPNIANFVHAGKPGSSEIDLSNLTFVSPISISISPSSPHVNFFLIELHLRWPFWLYVHFRMSELEDALILLIEDESYNGAALRITKAFGKDVATFQDTPLQ